MSKVILLSGSPNDTGNCIDVLEECQKALQSHNLETEIVSLVGLDLKDTMNEDCCNQDGFDAIINKIRGAQGLVTVAPVYWGTARAELMTALQRIANESHNSDKFLSRMVGGPIAVGRRGGLTSTIQEMMMVYLANDMIIPGSNYWNIVYGQNPGDVMNDTEGLETIRRFSENISFLISKISC